MPKMRVWWNNNIDGHQTFEVKNEKEAVAVYKNLIDLDLKNPKVTDNSGGCEVFEDGEWSEYYNAEGCDIDEIVDS